MAACIAALVLAPAAASRATSIDELVEITDFSGLSASPDGRHVVFRTERPSIVGDTVDLRWHAIDVATGSVTDLGAGGKPIFDDPGQLRPGAPLWIGPNKVAFPALVDDAIGVWSASVDGAGMRPLIVADANVEKPSLSPDRTAILYSLGPTRDEILRAEREEYDRGTLVDGSVDMAQNIHRGGSIDGRMATQRLVGYWFVRRALLWKAPRQPWRHDLASGKAQPDGPPQGMTEFKIPNEWKGEASQIEGGNTAVTLEEGGKSFLQARLAGAPAPVRCKDPLCARRASWIQWIPGSHKLVVAFSDGNRRQQLAIWDVDKDKVASLASSDGLLSGGRRTSIPCAVTSTNLFCVTAAAASPPRIERIDLSSGARTILFDPNARLRAGYTPRVEQLEWTEAGTTFHGTLLTPRGTARSSLPLFINFYACHGFLRGGEGDAWPVPPLIEHGFAVLCINTPPTPGPQDGVRDMRTALEGVRAIVKDLSARAIIDPARVGMGGFSHGSEITMWIAMHSRLLSAASISSTQPEPGGHWFDVLGAPDRAKAKLAVWGLGFPEKTMAQWKLQSPALNADRIEAPLLAQMPEQEARKIPELATRLSVSSTPFELYAFSDEDHIFVQPRHMAAIYERNLDWFQYWLRSETNANPEKADQYRRWDAMRARSCAKKRKGAPPLYCGWSPAAEPASGN